MTEKIKIDAPPGCGKTYSLMAKYANLIISEGYSADDITCTTFRTHSARDLISKVSEWTGEVPGMKQHVGTIHAICNRLLGYPDLIQPSEINHFLKNYKYDRYVRQVARTESEEETAYSGKPFDMYTWLKNTQTPVDRWYRYPGVDNIQIPSGKVQNFIEDYEEYKQNHAKIDFSDMIQFVLDDRIPLDTPVLMVDEFQDLTRQQYELFKMWTEGRESVTIAGDPLQALYSFWGGSPDYFREWSAQEITQDKSHRLLNPVWNLGVEVLRRERQYPPEIETRDPIGTPIQNLSYRDVEVVSNGNTSELHLVRCNFQADAIALTLAESGRVFGGLRGWTDSEINLFNCIYRIRNGNPLAGHDIRVLIESYPKKYFTFKSSKKQVFEDLKKYNPVLPGNEPYITPELYNLLQSDSCITYSNLGKLAQAKINGSLRTRSRPIKPEEVGKTRILTIHGAKGLEADTVFLHTGITPRIRKQMVIPGPESQGEARVWYVGITRARENLYLVNDAMDNYPIPEVVA
ncbi:UvrD-helicase domain-containing protein [Methanohalophilus sp.]